MRREIGKYTVELTGDLITINERDLGTIWGNTYTVSTARKHFSEICHKVEQRVYNQQSSPE
jgi:hypothetical protein